jgi:RNA polymerase sigma-70 factor (ECF subfamily)
MTRQDFINVFREHKDAIYRFAWRMTGSPAAAEDITQESFLALWKSSAAYDSARAPMRPYLLAVARNLILKRWRTEGRFTSLEEQDGDAVVTRMLTYQPASEEAGVLVAKAVASLPPLQRDVLILAEYEDLRLEEIARIAGVEVSAVKARLHRARNNLRRLLSDLRNYARTIE